MKLFGIQLGKRDMLPARRNRPQTLPRKRTFTGGQVDRLTASFTGSHLSINEELRRSLQRLQMRSRDLCENNDYARKFLKLMETNVVGANGISLQCQYQDINPDGTLRPSLLDQQFAEQHWKQWSKRRNCSADGKLSWIGIQGLVIKTIARDGEVLIEKIRNSRGDYALKLRVLECDHLDINHNEILSPTRRIVMGIELDNNDAPQAYWLSQTHPGDSGRYQQKRRRVPASNIMHLFVSDRPGQLRGIPWMHSAIRRLNMLGGYEEAELVAARLGASKMGFYTSPEGDNPNVSDMSPDGQDYDDHDLIQQAEPGIFEQLPEGVGFESFDPQHPTSAFPDFNKAMLRGAAAGMNIAFEGLSGNREDVNFSSIRSGVLEERDAYRVIHNFMIECLHEEIYSEWITLEVEVGQLSAWPNEKINTKFMQVNFQPRGWDWVAPHQDVKAKVEEYHLGTTTLTEIAAAKGKNLDDIFRQRQAELELAKSYGLTVGQVVQPIPPAEAAPDGDT